MPRLFDASEDLADKKGRLAVVTVHAPDVAAFEELDAPLSKLEETRWGRSFPFPILLDPSGETARRYGVNSYPRTVLIGMDGSILAATGGTERLLELLAD